LLEKCGKILVKDGWAICPLCGKGKLLKILPDTSVRNLPCKCKLCRQESIVNIEAPVPASKVTSA
jgi:hypothetical protein